MNSEEIATRMRWFKAEFGANGKSLEMLLDSYLAQDLWEAHDDLMGEQIVRFLENLMNETETATEPVTELAAASA